MVPGQQARGNGLGGIDGVGVTIGEARSGVGSGLTREGAPMGEGEPMGEVELGQQA